MLAQAGQESHFVRTAIELDQGLMVLSRWSVTNQGGAPEVVYMELEVIRPMFPSPQRLVATLPGRNRWSSENDSIVAETSSNSVLVGSTSPATIAAVVIFRPAATPTPVDLDIRMRLRVVKDTQTRDPAHVGPVLEGGEYIQNNVIRVVERSEARLSLQPSEFPFLALGDASSGLRSVGTQS